jgi:hypothetical protein
MNTFVFLCSFDCWGTNSFNYLCSFKGWGANTFVFLCSIDSCGTNTFVFLRFYDSSGTDSFVFLCSFDSWGTNICICFYLLWSKLNVIFVFFSPSSSCSLSYTFVPLRSCKFLLHYCVVPGIGCATYFWFWSKTNKTEVKIVLLRSKKSIFFSLVSHQSENWMQSKLYLWFYIVN